MIKKPKVGDKIYVGNAYYIDSEERDFDGGICIISKVEKGISAGKSCWNVAIKEGDNTKYNYDYLLENQKKWKKIYGKRIGILRRNK